MLSPLSSQNPVLCSAHMFSNQLTQTKRAIARHDDDPWQFSLATSRGPTKIHGRVCVMFNFLLGIIFQPYHLANQLTLELNDLQLTTRRFSDFLCCTTEDSLIDCPRRFSRGSVFSESDVQPLNQVSIPCLLAAFLTKRSASHAVPCRLQFRKISRSRQISDPTRIRLRSHQRVFASMLVQTSSGHKGQS